MGITAWSRQLAATLTGIVAAFENADGVLTLPQIATHAGVPLPTAERLVAQFAAWELLTPESAGHYRAGLLIGLHLQARADRRADVLTSLVRVGDRTARLGAVHPTGVAYLERQTTTPATAFSSVGTVSRVDSALGQALRAGELVGQSSAPAADSGTRPADRAIALTQLTGVAIVRYREAVTGVAVPVYRPDGTPMVALELIVRGRTAVEQAIDELPAAAQAIAGQLPEPTVSLASGMSGTN